MYGIRINRLFTRAPRDGSRRGTQWDILIFRVRADGFLYNMVRIMAGTLYETAIGHIPPDSIPERLASRNRRLMGRTAPPEGLYLNRVFYDDGEIPGYHGGTCHGN